MTLFQTLAFTAPTPVKPLPTADDGASRAQAQSKAVDGLAATLDARTDALAAMEAGTSDALAKAAADYAQAQADASQAPGRKTGSMADDLVEGRDDAGDDRAAAGAGDTDAGDAFVFRTDLPAKAEAFDVFDLALKAACDEPEKPLASDPFLDAELVFDLGDPILPDVSPFEG